MATAVLDAYSKAYPAITNRIRASIFLETDPAALIATIIDSVPGHPERIWHFPGLPRANYGFSLDEIDGGDNPINNLALFAVVPGLLPTSLQRKDEQIKVGTTPGFDVGLNTVTFDGTGGKPDYTGWDIVPSELTGRGILAEGLDYTWDPATAVFTLLQAGDILAEGTYYNIHFDPGDGEGVMGGSIPSINDFQARLVAEDDLIHVEDFGGTIICEPSGVYIELTLPLITTVPQGRVLTIETIKAIGQAVSCVKIIGPDINFNDNGLLFMMNNESLEIYRFKRSEGVDEWRIRNACGNFKRVGDSVGADCIQAGVYCKQLMNGYIANINQYARVYNELVLELPGTQVVDFDDWATGNNKYFYSLANSTDPDNADKFHFPDRRDLFERNNNAGKAGDFRTDQVNVSDLTVTFSQGNSFTGSPGGGWPFGRVGRGDASPNDVVLPVQGIGGGDETAPKQYLINKYVLI